MKHRWGAGSALMGIALLTGTACSKGDPLSHLPDLPALKANLAFTCTHEADHLPPLDPQAEQLYRYGRYLETRNGPKDFNAMVRYYRIAAAYGHYKANHKVQYYVGNAWVDSPDRPKELMDLATQLVNQGIPQGYYDIGFLLQKGYGLKQDPEMALRYFRKAADMGNPDAQYYVAEKLFHTVSLIDPVRQMYRCAAEQGHGEAANFSGVLLRDLGNGPMNPLKNNTEALKMFQLGVAGGGSQSAYILSEAFKAPPPGDLNHLGLPSDPERSRRYAVIEQFLSDNERANPKVPDLDRIVPLPPAALPEWDGTFQWLEVHPWRKEPPGPAPEQPSEDLIQRLAKAKNLDPATGLPIPPPPKAKLGTRAKTGERCPESGQWCVRYASGSRSELHRFEKGAVLPAYSTMQPRLWGLLDDLFGMRYQTNAVTWELMRYIKDTSA